MPLSFGEFEIDTSIKYSMAPQVYKFFTTHAHKILVWTILPRLLHAIYHNIGGMNGDVRSELSTLVFSKGEQLEDFHGRILIL